MKRLFSVMLFAAMFISLSAEPTTKAAPATTPAPAPVTLQLNGKVFDKLTQEVLAGAVITVNGQKVYTDLDGNFSVANLCGDKCQIKVALISYEEQTIEVDLNKEKQLQVKLQQR